MRSIALDQKELLQQLDSLQFGGASGTDDGNELGHVSLAGQGARQDSVQLAPKSFCADAVLSKYSVGPLCSGSVVEAEHSTEALPSPYHCAGCCQGRPTFDQVVPETLMVAFSVIVRHVLADRPA